MEFLKSVPKWLVSFLAVCITILFSFAIYDGRSATLWPPSIGPKNNSTSINDEISLQSIKAAPSIQDLIKNLPKEVQKLTVQETSDEINKRIVLIKKLKNNIVSLEGKVKIIEGLESDFIFRVLSFHKEASCYGDSLNFTYVAPNESTNKCTKKSKLAKQFLGFMAEINFYKGDVIESPSSAESVLNEYQQSKDFGHKGYYGRDVFKWIIIDYNG